jgi:replication factor C small subunit
MSSDDGQLLWAEKYRPKGLQEIADLEQIVRRLEAFVRRRNLPNLLFVGPPGTAKTTAALCLCNELYGSGTRENVLELNASDERGIQIVREVIKDFARSRAVGEAAPFKVLILDECDNMTNDAQQALRRTMEKYASTCRFILIANFQRGIIEPIQSRCSVFRFSPFPDEVVMGQIKAIAAREGVSCDDDGLKEMARHAEGDMRRAINIAEAAAASSGEITAQSVTQVTGKVDPKAIAAMLESSAEGDLQGAAKALKETLMRTGYSGRDVLRQIHRDIGGLRLSERGKLQLIEAAGEVDHRLSIGADPEIQLMSLLAKVGLLARDEGPAKGAKGSRGD